MRSNQLGLGFARFLVIFAITLGVWGLGSGVPVGEADDVRLSDLAVAEVSRETGIPTDELSVVRASPLRNSDIVQFKVRDGDGNVFGVALNRSGTRATNEEVEAIARVDNRFRGKMDVDLERLVRLAPENTSIRLIMWMEGVTDDPLRGDDVTEAQHDARLQRIASQVEAIMGPPMEVWTGMGGAIVYQPRHVPMAVAQGTAEMILQMEAHPDVQRMFLERFHSPRLNISRGVVGANVVNARGFTGTAQRVAIVESGRIASHGNLPAAQRIDCATFLGGPAGVEGHKTNVAGVIQSTNAVTRGMAPTITLVDGIASNFSDGEVMAATDCVIDTQGGRAVNMSFGTETNGVFDAFARFVDRKIYLTGATIIPAVSNNCNNRMGSPEIAFNALAVGAFSDRNTPGFGDDVHGCTFGFSAFRNPLSTSGDREEPDVVAPGHLIRTTTSAGGFGDVNGTSFAAPHVTGGVGLLFQRDPSLRFQTERVRAIIMASARHNIEGARRLSDRDGAGAILLQAADGVLRDGLSSFFTTPGDTTGFPITRTFSATAGQRVRVAIAWAHKSPGGDTLTRPTTDLDLRVTAPNSTVVGSSVSLDNTYEIVDFIAPNTGTYTATITNFRSSAGGEFIGFAASRTDT